MDIAEVIQIINTVGFPIFCVICLGYYVNELTKTHSEEIKVLTDKLTEVVLSVQTLADKIEEQLRNNNEN